jgi:hypothetical protein
MKYKLISPVILQGVTAILMLASSLMLGVLMTSVNQLEQSLNEKISSIDKSLYYATTTYEINIAEYEGKETFFYSLPVTTKDEKKAKQEFLKQCVLMCADYGCPDSSWVTLTRENARGIVVIADSLITK